MIASSAHTLPVSFEFTMWTLQLGVLWAHFHLFVWARRALTQGGSRRGVAWATLVLLCGLVMSSCSGLLNFNGMLFGPLHPPLFWKLGASVWITGILGAYLVLLAGRLARRYIQPPAGDAAAQETSRAGADPDAVSAPIISRRRILSNLSRAAAGVPFAVGAYGTFVGRRSFELCEVDLLIRDLPADLEGFRLAQVTDLHCGPYLPPRDVEIVAAMVNETKPHLVVVTGDFITVSEDPLKPCLDALSGMKADFGLWGCMGNHEIYARCEKFTEDYGRSRGIEFLRQRSSLLRVGDAKLNLCGVDYQRKRDPYLQGAAKLRRPGAVNVLLTHNPDVFPVAAKMGYDLVIAGHTHGGQITVEILEQWANPGHFFTPYVAGEYRIGDSALYVSRGIGTVTLPMRIGALPEVTLLKLRRA